MASITFCGVTYECAKALRGDNFVHLTDASGCVIAAFEGVVDFSAFYLSECSWTYVTSRNASTTNVYSTTYSGKYKEITLPGVTPNDLLTVIDSSNFTWAQENLQVALQDGKIILQSATAPTSSISITFSLMQYTTKAV